MDVALAPYFDEPALRRAFLDEARFPERLVRRDARARQRLRRREDWNDVSGLKHARPRWLARRWPFLYGEPPFADVYKACFVRDPFERLLSIYSYHTQSLTQLFPAAVASGSFRAWLEMGGTGSAKTPMRKFTHDASGRQIVDFIGRYESLQADWSAFLAAVGLPELELPHNPKTMSSHEAATDVFTPELRQIVLANPVWREDAEILGYL